VKRRWPWSFFSLLIVAALIGWWRYCQWREHRFDAVILAAGQRYKVEPALEELLKEDRQLRIVYKELPILGKDSVYATRVALAAHKQEKYDKFHAAMMATKGQIDEKTVLQVAAASELDIERLKRDLPSAEIDDVIKRNYDLAQALEIHGTPAFIIGDELVPGAIDIATLKQKIAALRKSG